MITNIVNYNPAHGEMYSIQQYVIKFISDLRQVDGFFQFPPPIKLTRHHDITEILSKVALSTITLNLKSLNIGKGLES